MPLRQLLREPPKGKGITRTGQSVQITDNGRPLWIVRPASAQSENRERAVAIDELLDEVLRDTVSPVSLSTLVKDARR